MKVGLFCAAGMSTSLLVKKMEEAARSQGIDAAVEAYPEGDLEMHLGEIDVALLGPQVAYRLKADQATGAAAGVAVAAIPMQMYGMMDGAKVLQLALDLAEGR